MGLLDVSYPGKTWRRTGLPAPLQNPGDTRLKNKTCMKSSTIGWLWMYHMIALFNLFKSWVGVLMTCSMQSMEVSVWLVMEYGFFLIYTWTSCACPKGHLSSKRHEWGLWYKLSCILMWQITQKFVRPWAKWSLWSLLDKRHIQLHVNLDVELSLLRGVSRTYRREVVGSKYWGVVHTRKEASRSSRFPLQPWLKFPSFLLIQLGSGIGKLHITPLSILLDCI